jgi:surfeit locus 1 family protein
MALHLQKPKTSVVALALIILTVLLGLGFWQLQRLAWKENLIARIEDQMQQKPLPFDAAILDKDLEYRKVLFTGRILPGKIFLLRPRVQNEKVGAHLIVPMQDANSSLVVFVNTGWVLQDTKQIPQDIKEILSRPITGILTKPVAHRFTPQNKPEKDEWYWVDIPALAVAAGAQSVAPVLLNLDRLGITPDQPNNHRQYAAFWFSMAAVFVVIFVLSLRKPNS